MLVEEEQAPVPVEEEQAPAFRQLLAKQHYNLQLLEEYRPTKDQLEAERVSRVVVVTIVGRARLHSQPLRHPSRALEVPRPQGRAQPPLRGVGG